MKNKFTIQQEFRTSCSLLPVIDAARRINLRLHSRGKITILPLENPPSCKESFAKCETPIQYNAIALGFSLIELMIALSICAGIAVMAYPSYAHYQTRVNRVQAEAALMNISNLLEQYYGATGTYIGATLEKIHWVNNYSVLPYHFEIEALSDQHYLLKAIPQLSQAFRDNCGTLGLTEANERLIFKSSARIFDCW